MHATSTPFGAGPGGSPRMHRSGRGTAWRPFIRFHRIAREVSLIFARTHPRDKGAMRGFPSYQQGLALLLGLVGGLVLFDRNAINFLSPFIVADLKLNNAELG